MNKRQALIVRCVVALVAVTVLASVLAKPVVAQDSPGAVYVLTNQTANSVMVYARAADGALSFSGNFVTGGAGAGTGVDPLGSQGSLVLGRWHRRLFAVNAGSNDVSVFAVEGQGLQLRLLDRESSGGTMPVSVAVHGNLVYVVNASGTSNIQGFFVDPCGRLIQIPGSSRALPGGASAGPGQIGFSPDGDVLVVTEKGTSRIDTWTITDEGLPENGKTISSSGATPFGFTFVRRDVALVTEAGPSAVSSYEADDNGTLELLSGTVLDTQKANCWVVATKNGRYAFVSNTGSGTISSYMISRDGFLNLLNAAAASTGPGTAPIDSALGNDSHFLFVRAGTTGMVAGFRVESDGSLTPVGTVSGVPAGAQGLAAR